MPPLQKLWLDEVLRYGWAYGPEGTALRGKDVWLVASTGGPADWGDPRAPMDEGSPTWAYAGGIAALLHHGYFNQTLEQVEMVLGSATVSSEAQARISR